MYIYMYFFLNLLRRFDKGCTFSYQMFDHCVRCEVSVNYNFSVYMSCVSALGNYPKRRVPRFSQQAYKDHVCRTALSDNSLLLM